MFSEFCHYLDVALFDLAAPSDSRLQFFDPIRPWRFTFFRRLPSLVGFHLPLLLQLASAENHFVEETDAVCQATHPRDRIYALIPFAGTLPSFLPDYSKSVEDVFIDTCAAHLEAGDCSVLEYAQCGSKRSTLQLPTWAVDWSANFIPVYGPKLVSSRRLTPYAFVTHENEVTTSTNSGLPRRCLQIRGASGNRVVDCIAALHSP
jgi:hypothetical protein